MQSTLNVSVSYFRKSISLEAKNFAYYLMVLQTLLFLSGTVELNPGPVKSKVTNLSFAVWNLDSIPARNYARIPLIETFQSTYNFDSFGVCESLLNNDIPNEDIFVNGFSPEPFRADKPENSRNGGVCLFFKENLPIKERCDLESLPETIVAEVKLNRKKIFFVLSYCHPNLSSDEFEKYTNSLEHIYESIRKENPSVTILTGDFNARSPLFWEHDIETREGRVLNNFLLSNNLEELINEPTHIRDDGSQSCIDLICTDQSYLFTDSGVLPSLDPHSKHNIIHGSLNFHIPCPPPYKRKVWDYKLAKIVEIRKDLQGTSWHDLFFNLNINQMSLTFTDTLMSILSKHIPHKIIKCNDRDAPWITSKLKTAIRRNSRVYRKWVKRGKHKNDFDQVRIVQNTTNKLIREAKQLYYEKLGDKLSDPQTGHKQFWNAFKTITNKKKYTNIPPIIENDAYISNFRQKANLFNDYFADQCKLFENGSTLPEVTYKTNESIYHINITVDHIVDIISKMSSNKAGGCDMISVRMLQLCPLEVATPLQIIFQKCIDTGIFPDSWKYANVQPVHKKNNRQTKSNYRPISLLPICGKLLEKIVFDHAYHHLNTLNLLEAGVPQGSVLGPLLFLIYINDLTDNITSQMRLFADDSSLFTCVKGVDETHEKLDKDLQTVTNWAHQWKIIFNPDLTKQAIEVIFSVKKNKPQHPDLTMNGVPVAKNDRTKHLGVYLDSGLNFCKHVKKAVLKALKGVSLLKYLSKYVDSYVLNLSYKLYVRPHLDYGDIIYHNQRSDLMKLIEQVQYKAALIVSGCWQGTSRERLYEELGWESLCERRWARCLTTFYKIKNGLAPSYLSEHIPEHNETDISFRHRNARAPFSRTERYANSFSHIV